MSKSRKYRVGVLFGGRSGEHDVSLASARNVMDALQKAGHAVVPIGISIDGHWLPRPDAHALLVDAAAAGTPLQLTAELNGSNEESWGLLPSAHHEGELPPVDVIFPVLHGPYGEDGTVQGLLEMANLPYVGCGVLASAVAMDKVIARRLFGEAGLPQVAWRPVMRNTWRSRPEAVLDELEGSFPYPLFVKPANMGSSVGISKARNRTELAAALELACRYDRKLLVEEAVPHVRELEVSVLGNERPIASVPGEIVPGNEFYDYNAKYEADNSTLLIPADLEPDTADVVRTMAVQAFQALDCEGLARVDFLLNAKSGRIFINEINTMPGFTRISMYPKLWEATGISYPDLVDRLVQLALERYADRQENSTSRR